jgi:hypothetical protein
LIKCLILFLLFKINYTMDAVFKKMNFKDSPSVVVINAPESFELNMETMKEWAIFYRDLSLVKDTDFIIAFCTMQNEVDAVAIEAATKLVGDGLLWFAYPKGTSKKLTCDFNRDTGWEILGKLGFEPVRAVAIDNDWSALRFRRVEFIKKMTRSFAMTEVGKEKIGK